MEADAKINQMYIQASFWTEEIQKRLDLNGTNVRTGPAAHLAPPIACMVQGNSVVDQSAEESRETALEVEKHHITGGTGS